MKSKGKSPYGFSLLEIMVAVAIAAMVMLGLATSMVNSSKSQKNISLSTAFNQDNQTLNMLLSQSTLCQGAFVFQSAGVYVNKFDSTVTDAFAAGFTTNNMPEIRFPGTTTVFMKEGSTSTRGMTYSKVRFTNVSDMGAISGGLRRYMVNLYVEGTKDTTMAAGATTQAFVVPMVLDVEDTANPKNIRDCYGNTDYVKISGDTMTGDLDLLYSTPSDALGRNINFRKDRTTTIVQDDDLLGSVAFKGYDGTTYQTGARIRGYVDGTPGVGDMPGSLTFSTTSDGSSAETERMRIDNIGNVGIGTTSPTARLHVYEVSTDIGSDDMVKNMFVLNPAAAASGSQYSVETVATVNTGNAQSFETIAGTRTLAQHNGTGTVADYAAMSARLVTGSTGTITNGYGFRVEAGSNTSGTITNMYGLHIGDITFGATTNAWSLYASDASAPSYFAGSVHVNGNLGIGTTSPTNRLHVQLQDAAITTVTYPIIASHMTSNSPVQPGFGAGIGFKAERPDGLEAAIGYVQGVWEDVNSPEDGALAFLTVRNSFGAGAEQMRITSVGNVGIGTSAPGQKLDIVGGSGRVETGQSWLTNSDARYKTNVGTIEDALDKVIRLRGVRYDAIKDPDKTPAHPKHIGFIAQELRDVVPEVVIQDDKGFFSVSYDRITALLAEGLKELAAQVSNLFKRLESLVASTTALEKENRALKERVTELEQRAAQADAVKAEHDAIRAWACAQPNRPSFCAKVAR